MQNPREIIRICRHECDATPSRIARRGCARAGSADVCVRPPRATEGAIGRDAPTSSPSCGRCR